MEERSLFEMITEGFDSALEWAQGNTKLRVTQFRDPGPPPRYEAQDVLRIRESVHMSQGAFANFLGVSRKTVASWEQGARTPSTGTSRLMQLIEDPQLLNRLRLGPAHRKVAELDEAEPMAGSATSRATVPKGSARTVRVSRKAKGFE